MSFFHDRGSTIAAELCLPHGGWQGGYEDQGKVIWRTLHEIATLVLANEWAEFSYRCNLELYMWVLSVIPSREIVWMVTVADLAEFCSNAAVTRSDRESHKPWNIKFRNTSFLGDIIWQYMAINYIYIYMICLKWIRWEVKKVSHWPIATRRCWCLDYSIRSFCHCAHLSLRLRLGGDEEHWQIPVWGGKNETSISIIKEQLLQKSFIIIYIYDVSLMV